MDALDFPRQKAEVAISNSQPMRFIPLLLIAFCLLFGQAAFAQAPGAAAQPPGQTPGFLDLPWGSNAEAVRKQLPARTHTRFDKVASTKDDVAFSGGKFADLKVSQFMLHLVSDRLWKADVAFEAASKDHQKEFATLRQLLEEKYGPPSKETKRGEGAVVEWYLKGPPGVDQDKIVLDSNQRGKGMTLFYAADRIAKDAAVPAAPPAAGTPANKPKPLSVAPKAKDDL